MKRIFAFAAAGIVGSAIGAYSAATMSGLLPGDRRTMEGISISGWNGNLDQGSSDASPYVRARIARHGLLAMAKSEAIYFTRATDDAGSPLRETCRYRLSGGPLPAGWWSVTLYDADNFLPDNDDEALSYDASRTGSGRWEAEIAPTRPQEEIGWISSRNAGQFDLTLRLYMPEPGALSDPLDAIEAPSLERLACEGEGQ